MSVRPEFMSLESPALDDNRDPANLRRYPSMPAADDYEVVSFKLQIARDEVLRERLRLEQQDTARDRREPRENYLAREYGVRRWGEL